MITAISKYFHVVERESTFSREIFAGLSTYLSLAYIFIVNPAILSKAHMNVSSVLFATVVASGISTIAMGIWARLPFAVAPGLEMNGFFTFVVVLTLNMTWQEALGTVFWSGILCVLLTISPVRVKIIDAIPAGLKINIGVSVGVFVGTIGLYLAKIVAFKNGLPDLSEWSSSQLYSHEAFILYVGLFISAVLGIKSLRFPGGMLIAIIAGAVVAKYFGITADKPAELSSEMFTDFGKLEPFSVLTNPRFLVVTMIFFIVDFYGGIGKFIGLTAATNIQSGGKVPNIKQALFVDGYGTILGSILGTSSLITFVESAVGIAAGGRTGITAIVCGILMLASLIFTPLVGLVPVVATTGILIYVGWLLLPFRQLKESPDLFGRFDLAVAAGMGILTFSTFSLDKAMLLGFSLYTIRGIAQRKGKVDYFLLVTTIVLLISTIVQYAWVGKSI
jgi:AGZA family xanthine/uracil permease-like MFS transporter